MGKCYKGSLSDNFIDGCVYLFSGFLHMIFRAFSKISSNIAYRLVLLMKMGHIGKWRQVHQQKQIRLQQLGVGAPPTRPKAQRATVNMVSALSVFFIFITRINHF